MTPLDTIKDVREHPFFKNLPEHVVQAVLSLAQEREYAEGAWLCREGDPADRFFLILSGTVAVELHAPHTGKRRIQTLGPGDAVGWSWLIPPHRWQFDVFTVHPTRVAEFDAERLRALCEQDHTVGYYVTKRLLEVVSRRLAAARIQLMDMYA